MTRRGLLTLLNAFPALREAFAAPSREARNLSYPLQAIEGIITPAEMFFIRDHFSEPELSLSDWRLKIEGRVARPLELGLADLLESPAKKLEAVLECAGNTAGGPAVGNGVWEGVPLAWLLQQAAPEASAVNVLLEGSDSGRLMQDSPHAPYCQVVPLVRCRQPDSLVALKLNDRFLLPRSGFPARALFPGWYAMDSVKWLQRIVVLGPDDPPGAFQSSGMSKVYNRVIETAPSQPVVTRLTEVLVKSAVAWPPDNWKLPVGRHTVRGFAWTGGRGIRRVDFSADGGRTWTPAKIEAAPKQYGWARWTFSWQAAFGDHVLMSRATDDAGHTQPLTREPGRKDLYAFNHCAPVRCSVQ